MPQLVSLLIIGLGAYALFRFLRDAGGGKPKVKKSPEEDIPTLKQDPKTGRYKPEDD